MSTIHVELSKALDEGPVAVLVAGADDHRVLHHNAFATTLLDGGGGSLVGRDVAVLIGGDQGRDAVLRALGEGGSVWESVASPVVLRTREVDVQGTAARLWCLTPLPAGASRAEGRDEVTGLVDNRLFADHLNRALRRARRHKARLAVLCCDLDDFMSVHDAFGDDYCNRVLVEASQRIRRSLRETDLVARHGEDVFAILLEDLATELGGQVVAEKILYEILHPFDRSSGEKVRLGCSIGVVHFDGGGEENVTPTQLIERADRAVGRAKRAGKGVFRTYDSEMDG